MERKGFISRELLFDPLGPSCNVKLTVPKILQEHRGVFMFLCGVSHQYRAPLVWFMGGSITSEVLNGLCVFVEDVFT
jgi:hypothetical protein